MNCLQTLIFQFFIRVSVVFLLEFLSSRFIRVSLLLSLYSKSKQLQEIKNITHPKGSGFSSVDSTVTEGILQDSKKTKKDVLPNPSKTMNNSDMIKYPWDEVRVI